MAGFVIFGSYPQAFLPACHVDVTIWPGTSDMVETHVRYIDRVICEGPLPTMVNDAVKAVQHNLRCAGVVHGIGRKDTPELPTEAVREAIANAVLHREYSAAFRGTPVNVRVFRDRVEVISPGGLWGGKTIDDLADGTSRCRNALAGPRRSAAGRRGLLHDDEGRLGA